MLRNSKHVSKMIRSFLSHSASRSLYVVAPSIFSASSFAAVTAPLFRAPVASAAVKSSVCSSTAASAFPVSCMTSSSNSAITFMSPTAAAAAACFESQRGFYSIFRNGIFKHRKNNRPHRVLYQVRQANSRKRRYQKVTTASRMMKGK